jgi:hypothetical protein
LAQYASDEHAPCSVACTCTSNNAHQFFGGLVVVFLQVCRALLHVQANATSLHQQRIDDTEDADDQQEEQQLLIVLLELTKRIKSAALLDTTNDTIDMAVCTRPMRECSSCCAR